MHPISDGSVNARFANGFPRAVELICPHCSGKAMFDAQPWQEHGGQIRVASRLGTGREQGAGRGCIRDETG